MVLDVDCVIVELGTVPVNLQGHVLVLQVGVKFVLEKGHSQLTSPRCAIYYYIILPACCDLSQFAD